ncbi:hypothetical protein ACH5RR_013605 [Cinchona calisaya]|uniref:RING-type E3 ubiquitin transferase n=1 Tax=Cinchona calisaya TaxID=153742 RepID=A0ABD3A1X8_9GENT
MVFNKLVFCISSLFGLRIKVSSLFFQNSNNNTITLEKIKEGSRIEDDHHDEAIGDQVIENKICCVICLSRLKEREDKRLLPCHHEFHRECVDKWLNIRRKTCPVCRFSMEDEEKVKTRKGEIFPEEMMIWFSSFHVAGF